MLEGVNIFEESPDRISKKKEKLLFATHPVHWKKESGNLSAKKGSSIGKRRIWGRDGPCVISESSTEGRPQLKN